MWSDWGKPKDVWCVENDLAFQKELAAIAAAHGVTAAEHALYLKQQEVRSARK